MNHGHKQASEGKLEVSPSQSEGAQKFDEALLEFSSAGGNKVCAMVLIHLDLLLWETIYELLAPVWGNQHVLCSKNKQRGRCSKCRLGGSNFRSLGLILW